MLPRSLLIQNQQYVIRTEEDFEDVIAMYLGDNAADVFKEILRNNSNDKQETGK